MSQVMGKAVSSFVTSVVIGKDMVPRLSLPNVHALLGDVVRAHTRLRLAVWLNCDRADVCT